MDSEARLKVKGSDSGHRSEILRLEQSDVLVSL